MEILMSIKELINGFFMTMNLLTDLLMAIRIVLNEVESNTANDFSLHFSDHLNKHQGQFTYNQYSNLCFKLFLQAICLDRCAVNLIYRLILDFPCYKMSRK